MDDKKDILDDYYDSEPAQCSDNFYDGNERRERFGNNRYHVPKALAKIRRKIAKQSQRKNRKK